MNIHQTIVHPMHVSRRDRNQQRGLLMMHKCREQGMDAMTCAKAAIEATFGIEAKHNNLKHTVEYAIKGGAWAIQNRCRYAKLAHGAFPDSLGRTIALLETYYRNELKLCERWGSRRSVPDNILEARLFLRWLRRFGGVGTYPEIIDALTTGPQHARPSSVLIAE